MVGPGVLAFTFGLRHAVDADHIAAIDNVTRKLIQDGTRPLTVGLWFSLGHSTVVAVLCVVIAAGSSYMRSHIKNAQNVGAIVGTCLTTSLLACHCTSLPQLSTRLGCCPCTANNLQAPQYRPQCCFSLES